VPELDVIKKKTSRKEGLLALDDQVSKNSTHIFPVAFANREPQLVKRTENAIQMFADRYLLFQSSKGWTYTR
jgi:hypothetical protein